MPSGGVSTAWLSQRVRNDHHRPNASVHGSRRFSGRLGAIVTCISTNRTCTLAHGREIAFYRTEDSSFKPPTDRSPNSGNSKGEQNMDPVNLLSFLVLPEGTALR